MTNRHNKTRKLNGGIRITPSFTPQTAINHFVNNSTFSVFSTRGTTSTILVATLKEGIISPYRTVRSNEFNMPVNKILLKLCSASTHTEILIQKDIFHKSFTDEMSYFEPICPSVVFASSNKFKKKLKNDFYSVILNSLENTENTEVIHRIFERDVYLIAMELMDNYKPLSDFIGTPFFQKYRFMAIYELHRLHQFGYTHNDFHYENVLINPTYSYFNQTSGRAILIDFGYSSRTTTNQNAVELLQYEISGIDKNIMDVFNYFYTQRKAYQHTCLTNLEIKLNDKLNRIIHHITLYRGGEMNDDTPQKSQSPQYRENEWSGLDYESFKEIIANEFEENFQKSDPEGFKKYNDSINSVLEEQKTDPQYFEKLVKAQFNGLIVQRR
jgi:tRNA A-37 threonylcarbamoyl transferase component Bud32